MSVSRSIVEFDVDPSPVTSVGILSSFPPTQCGLATFTMALGSAIERRGSHVGIVRVLDEPDSRPSHSLGVVAELVANDPASFHSAIEALNAHSVALIQHEYGLYGGGDGSDVLFVLRGLRVPSIAILHTVLPRPTTHQISVLDEVIATVDEIVVMTAAARETLHDTFRVGSTPISVIPHGAAIAAASSTRPRAARPLILTWGLIGPGKGIEWAIEAVAELRDLDPRPLYLIAGKTHPKVLAHQGDEYRRSLERRVVELGVSDMVEFDNTYRELDSLERLIQRADVIVLPYDSPDQATSGVLVDAVAAGRPVVATSFPHAVELLSGGAGVTVAHRDPHALSVALRHVLVDPDVASELAVAARRLAPRLGWDAVAGQYLDRAAAMVSERDFVVL